MDFWHGVRWNICFIYEALLFSEQRTRVVYCWCVAHCGDKRTGMLKKGTDCCLLRLFVYVLNFFQYNYRWSSKMLLKFLDPWESRYHTCLFYSSMSSGSSIAINHVDYYYLSIMVASTGSTSCMNWQVLWRERMDQNCNTHYSIFLLWLFTNLISWF